MGGMQDRMQRCVAFAGTSSDIPVGLTVVRAVRCCTMQLERPPNSAAAADVCSVVSSETELRTHSYMLSFVWLAATFFPRTSDPGPTIDTLTLTRTGIPSIYIRGLQLSGAGRSRSYHAGLATVGDI